MIELNKRQYEILTFMANTDVVVYGNSDTDIFALFNAGLVNETEVSCVRIAPHAREMFRDAGLRRVQ
jgi:hypothetical protein